MSTESRVMMGFIDLCLNTEIGYIIEFIEFVECIILGKSIVGLACLMKCKNDEITDSRISLTDNLALLLTFLINRSLINQIHKTPTQFTNQIPCSKPTKTPYSSDPTPTTKRPSPSSIITPTNSRLFRF